ncbi:hypothetical protein FO519_008384 [Halicephalobus sp. NKZ332]|nr:hypothetical protein FO519_008384 [Halicephalobus sp. NKZ332]
MGNNKIIIQAAGMPHEMAQDATAYALLGFEKFKQPMAVAEFMKKEFDRKYGGKWYCFIGSFASATVNHDPDCYIRLHYGKEKIVFFKRS